MHSTLEKSKKKYPINWTRVSMLTLALIASYSFTIYFLLNGYAKKVDKFFCIKPVTGHMTTGEIVYGFVVWAVLFIIAFGLPLYLGCRIRMRELDPDSRESDELRRQSGAMEH